MNDPIEVEVLAVDDGAPIPPRESPDARPAPSAPWEKWQGRVRQLDPRWWPLWLVLGIIALGLILTVGVLFAIVAIAVKVVGSLLGGVWRALAGDSRETSLRP